MNIVEVRDSRTGYFIPARYGMGSGQMENCRRAATAIVVGVIWKIPKYQEMCAFSKMGICEISRNVNLSEIKAPAGTS